MEESNDITCSDITGPITKRQPNELIGVLQSATPPTSPESSVQGKLSGFRIYSHSVHGANIYASSRPKSYPHGASVENKHPLKSSRMTTKRELQNVDQLEEEQLPESNLEESALNNQQDTIQMNTVEVPQVEKETADLLSVEEQLAEYLRISHSGRIQDLRELRHWVFVYGTLKRSFPNAHLLQKDALYEGDFVTCDKYPLVVGGPYYSPYLLDMKGYGDNVRGELYRVSSNALKQLDQLENVGVNYTRRVIPVCSVKDRSFLVGAFVYLKCNYTKELLQSEWLSDYQDNRYVPRHLRPQTNHSLYYQRAQSMQDLGQAEDSTNKEKQTRCIK
eukprot:jgi/Galph1/4177/GphlegSOOS_G2849.1